MSFTGRTAMVIATLTALAACNPQEAATDITRQAARAVIVPVLATHMPSPLAQAGADCIIASATLDDLRALAVDYGNAPGTSTINTVTRLIAKPQVLTCFAQGAIPVIASM